MSIRQMAPPANISALRAPIVLRLFQRRRSTPKAPTVGSVLAKNLAADGVFDPNASSDVRQSGTARLGGGSRLAG
jgi:hypothetical protein